MEHTILGGVATAVEALDVCNLLSGETSVTLGWMPAEQRPNAAVVDPRLDVASRRPIDYGSGVLSLEPRRRPGRTGCAVATFTAHVTLPFAAGVRCAAQVSKAAVMGVAKQMNLPIRWGGDWDMDNDLDDSNFLDLVHFEIKE